jgi:hypothetical protein
MSRLNNQFCLKRPRFFFVSVLAGNRTRTKNTSSEAGHGESWPGKSWQTVEKKQYKLQCKG